MKFAAAWMEQDIVLSESVKGQNECPGGRVLALHVAILGLFPTPHIVPRAHQEWSLSTIKCGIKTNKKIMPLFSNISELVTVILIETSQVKLWNGFTHMWIINSQSKEIVKKEQK